MSMYGATIMEPGGMPLAVIVFTSVWVIEENAQSVPYLVRMRVGLTPSDTRAEIHDLYADAADNV